jgi:hypothetical protein
MRIHSAGALAAVVISLAGLLVAGCPSPTPPPEAILAGTWELTTEETTELEQTLLTFDANGNLDKVVYQIGNITFTDNNPRGSTTVNGQTVTIDATFAGSGQIFNGTLNADNTVITGTSGTVIRFGNLTIDIDNGAVTLTKQ